MTARLIFHLLCTVIVAVPLASPAAPSAALGYPPKYRPGFDHFDYVRPDAPKGGELVMSAFGNFDSFNPFAEGESPLPARGVCSRRSWSRPRRYRIAYTRIWPRISSLLNRLAVTFRLDPSGASPTVRRYARGRQVLIRHSEEQQARQYRAPIHQAGGVLDARRYDSISPRSIRSCI